MYKQLHFRRQFIFAKTKIERFENWNCLKINGYYLCVHPDIEVTRIDDLGKSVILIGSIYDPYQPEKDNANIIRDIHGDICSLKDLFLKINPYFGNYALFYKDDKNTIVVQDALSLREVYYCTDENLVICGSQPNLVAQFADPKTPARNDVDFLEYYAKNSINGRWNPYRKWIGDETYFEGVKHLLPNHFLDLDKREVHRYWPYQPIKKLDLDEAVPRGCSLLHGSMRALVHRHQVMMAVTAGTDSRTLLAASRGIQDKIYYFVNNEGLGYNHPDIAIPKKIFESINVSFHVHNAPKDVDDEFRKIFLSNTFFASERILPTIYNIYFKSHGEKVNILGIGEIGRTRYGKEPKNLNRFRMLYKVMGNREGRYELRQAERILSELLPVGKAYGLNVLTLLYWEHALGNWGVTGNSESDIAIEELNPFDSHLLYETLLGVDEKYSRIKKSTLFIEMIRNMWPELLEWPMNPPYELRDKVKSCLYKMGVYGALKELKYQLSYLSHLLKARRQ
jgi:hypothetical protein